MVMASARVDRGGSASPRRAHGGLVYLHGVGGARQDWYRPLADAVGGLTLDHVAPAFDDLLTTSGSVHARRQPTVTQDTVATDHARHAYRARQARLADLVAGVGESTPVTWPAMLPHPADIAERLPLTHMLRAPVFGLDQVGRYLDDEARRAAVLHRVTTALLRTARPRVVLAHSLGSLIAWDLLADPRVEIDLLITLGSPLAQPAVTVTEGPFPYSRVGAWLNVVHLLDPVPAGRGLAESFPAACDAFLPPVPRRASPASAVSRFAAAVGGALTSHLDSTYLASATVHAAIREAMHVAGGASLPLASAVSA